MAETKTQASTKSGNVFVYSTLTADNLYCGYAKREAKGDQLPLVERSVLIKGGANVYDSKRIMTPKGICTQVSAEEYEFLKTVPAFNDHVKGGFLLVSEHKEEAEKVVVDLNKKDGSAPKVASDFEKKPDVGKANK